MRIPRKPRNLSPAVREGIAQKHARYMEMFGENDWKTIDRKIQEYGNDYYNPELFVDKSTMAQAIDDYDAFRTGTPAMNVVADDMRQFYELTPNKAPSVVTPVLKPEVQQTPVVSSEPVALPTTPAAVSKSPSSVVIAPEPEPAQVAAELQRQAYVNDILGYDVQNRYEEAIRREGLFMDDGDMELGLLVAGALASGALAGKASKEEEDEIFDSIRN